jgi:nanoRNase/pAp phosphatase (c-di-AMP/oligoRNAs hydrolase)
VARFSARFGGGGHVKAAGFNMEEPIEQCVEIIAEELMKEMSEGNE